MSLITKNTFLCIFDPINQSFLYFYLTHISFKSSNCKFFERENVKGITYTAMCYFSICYTFSDFLKFIECSSICIDKPTCMRAIKRQTKKQRTLSYISICAEICIECSAYLHTDMCSIITKNQGEAVCEFQAKILMSKARPIALTHKPTHRN